MAAIDIDTLANCKLYMGLTETTYDTMLQAWITELSGVIEARINSPVNSIATTDYLDGSGDYIQYMQTGRIISLQGTTEAEHLASLQYRMSVADSWANLFDDEDYIYINPVYSWRIEATNYMIFPAGIRNIKCAYNCGMTGQSLADMKKVLKEMVQVMFDESKAGGKPRLGMSSANRGAAGASSGDSFLDMNKRWIEVLDQYRRTV